MLKKNIRSVKLIRTERGIQMKKDVFQNCPIYQSDRFEIRKMEMKDAHELFRCYSNPQAARYFNGDCCGDDFYYTDYEFWESRYQVRDFVRFTIVDQKQKEIAGMVEICPSYKYSADGSKIGILRIDLLPEYENEKMLNELLTLILEHIYEDFEVQAVLMKAQEYATARRSILKQFHFVAAMDECNISFRDYFIRF